MSDFEVRSAGGTYSVRFHQDIGDALQETLASEDVILIDARVAELYAGRLGGGS